MTTIEDYLSGQVLLIDKPLHWTSFQAVNKLRWEIRQAFNIKKIKVGHDWHFRSFSNRDISDLYWENDQAN